MVVGVIVTAAAIFGAIYKVTAPTTWSVYGVAGSLIVGVILAFLVRGRQSAHMSYARLSECEQGPVKL